jgi:hypothetical protein
MAVCALLLGAAGRTNAQTGTEGEGAKDLIRAIGARSLGIGQATVSVPVGTEAVWTNPALIMLSHRSGSLDFRTKAVVAEPESDIAGAVIIPVQYIGALAFFARYMDYGPQEATIGTDVGSTVAAFRNTSLIFGASAATTFFDRLSVGFSAKELQVRFPCTGDCSQVPSEKLASATSNAIDLGVHYYLLRDSSLAIGASALNFGPRLQLIDREQADSLPSRLAVGVSYVRDIPSAPGLRMRVAADVVSRVTSGGKGQRYGAELSYLNTVYLRAGYLVKGPGEIDSPTIGFGLSRGRVHFDFAQIMAGAVESQTAKPTFFALRYTF